MQRFKSYLIESNRAYEKMFEPWLNIFKNITLKMIPKELNKSQHVYKINKANFQLEIKWAKRVLKKNDRIVWYFKWYRTLFIHFTNRHDSHKMTAQQQYASEDLLQDYYKDLSKRTGSTIGHHSMMVLNIKYLKDNLEHFYNLRNVGKIQKETLGKQTPEDLFNLFSQYEREWADKKGHILLRSDVLPWTLFLRVDNTFVWFDLESNSCDDESEAMGHCGTGPAGTTILSLREKEGPNDWKPRVTFIYDPFKKTLGERKGHFNKKPDKKYHKQIIALLMDKRIKGIQVSPGHAPENDFNLDDLTQKQFNDVISKKPQLMSIEMRMKMALDNGNVKSFVRALKDSDLRLKMRKDGIVLKNNTRYLIQKATNNGILANNLSTAKLYNNPDDIKQLTNRYKIVGKLSFTSYSGPDVMMNDKLKDRLDKFIDRVSEGHKKFTLGRKLIQWTEEHIHPKLDEVFTAITRIFIEEILKEQNRITDNFLDNFYHLFDKKGIHIERTTENFDKSIIIFIKYQELIKMMKHDEYLGRWSLGGNSMGYFITDKIEWIFDENRGKFDASYTNKIIRDAGDVSNFNRRIEREVFKKHNI